MCVFECVTKRELGNAIMQNVHNKKLYGSVATESFCEVVCICTHSNVPVYLFCVCQHVFANVTCTHDCWSKCDCTEQ